MEYKSKYKLLTSTFHPFQHDGILRHDIQSGGAVYPKIVEETKIFEEFSDAEAIKTTQYIAYHMARVINPHEFNGFAEVFIMSLEEKDSNRKIKIPSPGNHYADSAIRKHLRLSGENHFVEIVGINSDLLYPSDLLTKTGKRNAEPDLTSSTPETEAFFKEYLPLMKEKRPDINIFPSDKSLVMLPYKNN